jgi:hypothetical protein
MLRNNTVSQEPLNVFSPILDQIGAVESVKAASDIVEFLGFRLFIWQHPHFCGSESSTHLYQVSSRR